MNKKIKTLLAELPMCYGTFNDYRENENITYKDYLYMIEKKLIVSSHGYYYKTKKASEATNA